MTPTKKGEKLNATNAGRDPEVNLWCAVISQALDDATLSATDDRYATDHRQARLWFTDAGRDFREVCASAGLEASVVRTFALKVIAEADERAARGERRQFIHRVAPKLRKPVARPAASVLPSRRSLEAVAQRRVQSHGRKAKLITHNGVSLTAAEWAEALGISKQSMHVRLKTKPLDEALTPPPAWRIGG